MLWIRYIGHVPAKSNRYEIVTRYVGRGKKHATLKKVDDVVVFESQLARIAEDLCTRLGGTPYLTGRVELWVVWHRLYHDGRRRDVNNIMKAIEDALTDGKLWADDSQVSRSEQQVLYDAEESEWIEIITQLDPLQPTPRKKSRRSRKPGSSLTS